MSQCVNPIFLDACIVADSDIVANSWWCKSGRSVGLLHALPNFPADVPSWRLHLRLRLHLGP
jgi:hypothetical protein